MKLAFFYCKCMAVKKSVTTTAVWCLCFDMCWSASGLTQRCFCTISENVNTVKKYYETSFDVADPLKESWGLPGIMEFLIHNWYLLYIRFCFLAKVYLIKCFELSCGTTGNCGGKTSAFKIKNLNLVFESWYVLRLSSIFKNLES